MENFPMTTYPVVFSVSRPERFDRIQILLRILILATLSCVGLTLGAVMAAGYLVLPLIAAVLLSQRGPERFMTEGAPRLRRALTWVMAFFAYFFLLTDRAPLESPEPSVQLEIRPSGAPTAGDALLRFVTSIPSALVFLILNFIAYIFWIVGALMILLTESYPAGLYDFQCGVLRWMARLVAYHASLVDTYPPFTFDAGPDETGRSLEPAHGSV
jgi:hypothetical protein